MVSVVADIVGQLTIRSIPYRRAGSMAMGMYCCRWLAWGLLFACAEMEPTAPVSWLIVKCSFLIILLLFLSIKCNAKFSTFCKIIIIERYTICIIRAKCFWSCLQKHPFIVGQFYAYSALFSVAWGDDRNVRSVSLPFYKTTTPSTKAVNVVLPMPTFSPA